MRPKLQRSVHYCEKTKQATVKEYRDEFDLYQDKQLMAGVSNSIPLKDAQGNVLQSEYGYYAYKDYQTLVL